MVFCLEQIVCSQRGPTAGTQPRAWQCQWLRQKAEMKLWFWWLWVVLLSPEEGVGQFLLWQWRWGLKPSMNTLQAQNSLDYFIFPCPPYTNLSTSMAEINDILSVYFRVPFCCRMETMNEMIIGNFGIFCCWCRVFLALDYRRCSWWNISILRHLAEQNWQSESSWWGLGSDLNQLWVSTHSWLWNVWGKNFQDFLCWLL